MRTRNLAVVFVDLAGFTSRTAKQTREESAAWLRDFEGLVRPLTATFRGRVVKSIGDALMMVFESPTDALLFGMAVEDRVFEYNRTADESRRMEIRVAANVGEVRLQQRDVFGEAVNIAARIEELAPAGEIWFSEAVYLAMNKSEVAAEKIGPHQLKGVPEPVTLYRVPRSSAYRLAPGTGQQENEYPYGRVALSRISGAGLSWRLENFQRGLAEKLALLLDSLRALGQWRGAKKHWRWVLLIVGLVATGLLLWQIYPADSFTEVAAALERGNPRHAIELLQFHPEHDQPRGMVLMARALLSLPEPEPEQAWEQLSRALEKKPQLLEEKQVRLDVVSCLDRENAQKTIDWLLGGPAEKLLDELVAGSAQRRYFLRWNSIRVLEKLGKADRVDLAQAYIYDLEFAGSCATRKRAAQKLGQLKDKRALEPLRRAKERGFLENLCMGDALDDALRTIEKNYP